VECNEGREEGVGEDTKIKEGRRGLACNSEGWGGDKRGKVGGESVKLRGMDRGGGIEGGEGG